MLVLKKKGVIFMMRVLTTIMALLMLPGCSGDVVNPTEMPTEAVTEVWVDPVEEKIDGIISGMSLEDKVCQMLFVTKGDALEARAGGVIYFADDIKTPDQVRGMIDEAQKNASVPLFVGVDEEGGVVARVGNNPNMGTTKLPAMKNVKSKEEAYNVGATLGKELKALHFNLDFAPVADVITNSKNKEIGSRSFGTDPVWVSDMVSEVVRGLEDNGVSSVLKHFPGHGSTQVDSHTGYSESARTYEELKACEFLPFIKGIEAGCDFVMISHMTLVNATKEKLPSSLSGEVIEGFLRSEIGFNGIVITDSLRMGAISDNYTAREAAVMAVKAGNDMLLMSPDTAEAVSGIIAAVESGEIDEERIDESVRRILRVKIEKGIIE